ncbi:MAG: hypothetical protein O7F73_03535 [Gammaproteobacteria bacterium]|nr:hypothetical protein [Gammaproteobacteria bacterium]
MSLTIINAELVRQLLPMSDCMEVMRAAMIAASTGTIAVPPRRFMPLIDNSGSLGLMPGSSLGLNSYGAKVISLHPDNPGRSDDRQITLYNSLGMTAQDLYAARLVYDKAVAQGLGTTVDF